jgi:hypothetical protein
MALLLGQRGSEVVITGRVVRAAAGNESSGKEVITLLLDQRGIKVKITEEVVRAAAGNRRSGKVVRMINDLISVKKQQEDRFITGK